jgi:hypothetical protein
MTQSFWNQWTDTAGAVALERRANKVRVVL